MFQPWSQAVQQVGYGQTRLVNSTHPRVDTLWQTGRVHKLFHALGRIRKDDLWTLKCDLTSIAES